MERGEGGEGSSRARLSFFWPKTVKRKTKSESEFFLFRFLSRLFSSFRSEKKKKPQLLLFSGPSESIAFCFFSLSQSGSGVNLK